MASPSPPQSSTPQPLDISDLIRPLSPSPHPAASRATSPSGSRSSVTPEPLDRVELDEIRNKVLEMGILRDGRKKQDALDKRWDEVDAFSSDRERLLAQMVSISILTARTHICTHPIINDATQFRRFFASLIPQYHCRRSSLRRLKQYRL